MSRIYDSQKVKELFDRELELLKESHPEIDTEKISINLSNEIDEHFKYIKLPLYLKEQLQHYTAGMILETDERKAWWLYELLRPLIAHDEIREKLKERYGSKYDVLIHRLFSVKDKINKIKYYLDMRDKSTIRSNEYMYYDKLYLDVTDKIELIQYEMWDVLIYITEISNVGTYHIPGETMNRMTKEIKKPEYKEENRQEMEQRRVI